jgi:hypothetical protein
MRNKIWIVTELFYPEETATAFIFTRIANHLSKTYKVSVICGPQFYDNNKKEFFDDIVISKDIEIFRTKTLKLDKNSLIQRTLKFIILTLQMGALMRKKIAKGEIVILATNPAPLLLLVGVLKHFKKFQLHILVHDVFPENTIPAKIFKNNKSIIYKTIKILFDNAYSSAEHLIVIGRDMHEILSNKTNISNKPPEISIVPNWSNPEKFSVLSRKRHTEDRIIIQYAGNIGRVQGIIEVLDAFRLSNNSRLSLKIRGTGTLYKNIEDYIKKFKLDNVLLSGSYARTEECEILTNCDIGLVSLSDGMYGLGVPSKSYQLLSAGKPILYIGEPKTEISQLVSDNGIGWSLDIRNQNEIIVFFNDLISIENDTLLMMGKRARWIAENEYNEQIILNLLQSKIESISIQKG